MQPGLSILRIDFMCNLLSVPFNAIPCDLGILLRVLPDFYLVAVCAFLQKECDSVDIPSDW